MKNSEVFIGNNSNYGRDECERVENACTRASQGYGPEVA